MSAFRLLFVLLCTLLLQACQRPVLTQQESFVFGTRVDITIADAPAETANRAASAVLREFDRLHRTYHAWQDSELTTLNQDIAQGKPHRVSPELADLIRDAQARSAQGQHLFDPGIGKLIALWGFQSDEFAARLPNPAELVAWRARHPSIADLNIDTRNTVRSRSREVALDFGGYLKGWALDRAARILQEQGIQNALINIGGNILALGTKHGQPWRVGIQHPRAPGALATVELAAGEAIGTSGDYQRFFELDGQRYPHLLDPRSGHPAQHTEAVTVLIPAGMDAGTRSDASSKPIFIAGPTGWQTAASTMQVKQVLRVNADGQVQVTAAMAKRLSNLAPNIQLEVVALPQ